MASGDIAELGFEVNTNEIKAANDQLDRLTPATERAERATDRYNRSTKNARGSVDLMARGVTMLRTQVLALGAAFASGVFAFNGLISAARVFSAAMGEVSTLIEGTPAQLAQIESEARRLARTFGTDAAGQVKAFYQAISAGASNVTQATEILESANRVAIGGLTDTTTAVDVLTTAVNAYAASGLKASDASDTLFVGMKAGKTTIGELASTLGNVVPIAASLGVEFNELVAGVAALTTQGQSTAQAVTGVRAILSQIAKPTSEATKLAKALGLEFNTTALEAQGLSGFLETVIEKTGGSADKLAKLFGSVEALNAVLSFAGGGGTAFNKILGDMETRAGATQTAYEKIAETMDQRVNVAFAKLADRALTLGNLLLQVMVPALEFVADNIDRLATYAGTFAAVMAGAYVVSLIAAAGATGTLSAALGVLRVAMIRTGIGALIILAGELVYQFIALVERTGGLSQAFAELGRMAQQTWERIVAGAEFMYRSLTAYSAEISSKFIMAWTDIQNGFFNMLRTIQHATGGKISFPGLVEFEESIISSYDTALRLHGTYLNELDAASEAWDRIWEDKSPKMDDIGSGATFDELTTKLGAVNTGLVAANDNAAALGETGADAMKKLADGADTAHYENERLIESYKFGQSVTQGFFSTLFSDLRQGASLWSALGNAAWNALESIANKATEMLSNGIWDLIFGALGGSIAGGASIPTGGFIPGITGPKLFASGGYTGDGGTNKVAGAVHGKEFVLNARATRNIGVDKLNAINDNGGMLPVSNSANSQTIIYEDHSTKEYNITGNDPEAIVEAIAAYDEGLPERLNQIQSDPRARRVS